MSVRVYVPATTDLLRAWSEQGSVPADADRFVADDESEESEYAALEEAADAAADLLAGPGRRVVVVGEASDPDAEVPWRMVAAVHADPAEIDPARGSDPGDLAWYAVQEVPDLIG